MSENRQPPYRALDDKRGWYDVGTWPCRWVCVPKAPQPPFLAAYRLRFRLDSTATLRIFVTADERYELFCDGSPVGIGPERGHPSRWFFETYELKLSAGSHCLAAKVWSLGRLAPMAQMSVRHGFLLGAEGIHQNLLGTGVAAWEGKIIPGCGFLQAKIAWGAGARVRIDCAKWPWGVESGSGQGWEPVEALHPGVNGSVKNDWPALHRLWPATLPPQLGDPFRGARVRHVDDSKMAETEGSPVEPARRLVGDMAPWQRLLDEGAPLEVPAHSCRRVILDFGTYRCVYSHLQVGGGQDSCVRIRWAEALFEGTHGELSGGGALNARTKGNRDVVDGKCFIGEGDEFLPDGGGGRRFDSLWWSAGRYVEVALETGPEPLTVAGLWFSEARYPLKMQGRLDASDPRWTGAADMSLLTLQMCSHETYMDCPYYEQLHYIADARLSALATYAATRDDRLPRKSLQLGFDSILTDRGLTQSRFPSRHAQVIPPFSLWWVAMLHDYALWRGDMQFVGGLMKGARSVLDTFLARCSSDGLLPSPDGWNFVDWVPAWAATTRDKRNWGVPPGGAGGVSGVLNWHMVYTLERAAELEEWLGEPELARRWRRRAGELAKEAVRAFWDEDRGLFADDAQHKHWSEHSQILALLGGRLDPAMAEAAAKALFEGRGLERCTIYFSHYLFECAELFGRPQPLFSRMEEMWFPLKNRGFCTLPEEPEPARSDCHAWGVHPLYHFYATVLGVRPQTPGGNMMRIRPMLGPLRRASGAMPHPRGDLSVELEQDDGALRGRIILPPGVIATLHANGSTRELSPGEHTI